MARRPKVTLDDELRVLKLVWDALEPLPDSSREFVVNTVSDKLGINRPPSPLSGRDVSSGRAPSQLGVGSGPTGNGVSGTVKQFLRDKKPRTEVERIAVLAYYLTHSKEEPHFNTKDLSKINTEAAGTKFSNAAVPVDNATRRAGFLAPADGGKKQITTHGEDVVEALPDYDAVKTLITDYRPSKRRKSATKSRRKKTRG